MIQINLVPDVKQDLIRAKRNRNFIISISIIVMAVSVGVVALLGVIVGVQLVDKKLAADKITQLDKEFQGIDDVQKIVTIQNQLKSIQSTHDNKNMTSRIFALLQEASAKDTTNSVSFNSFNIDTSGNIITMVVQTNRSGFDAADVFKKNIEGMKMYYVEADKDAPVNEFKSEPLTQHEDEKDVVIASNVEISNLSYSNNESSVKTVNFRLTFEYDPLLFDSKIDVLRIRGIGRGNVTDSYQRLPQSLFEASPEQAKESEQAQ